MMHKKFLALMLCSVFAVGKTEALCCFSKKAVGRRPDQQAFVRLPEPAKDQDEVVLLEAVNCVEQIERLRERLAGQKDLESALDCLQSAVAQIKSDELYQRFTQWHNDDIYQTAETHCYADDRQAQGKAIEAAWPKMPTILSACITSYLWQQGMAKQAYATACGATSEVVIVDKHNKRHVLVSPATREIFGYQSIASLRFVTRDHLAVLALLPDPQPESEDPQVRAREDENVEKYLQFHKITGSIADLARTRQLWVVPVVDEEKYDA